MADNSDVFPENYQLWKEYRWREGSPRIMVKIFNLPYKLRDGIPDNNVVRKELKDDEDIDALRLKELFKDEQVFPAGAKVECDQISCASTPNAEDGLTKAEKSIRAMDIDEYKQYDCFVFVFLTFSSIDGRLHFGHGDLQQGLVPLDNIIDKVKELEVTKGKPKLFLVQADDMTLTIKDVGTKAKGEPEKVRLKIKIPSDSDRLIIYSTLPQKLADFKSGPRKGRKESLMIQAFAEAMRENVVSPGLDLLTLTTKINGKVKQMLGNISLPKEEHEYPLPLVTSTLTKFLNMQDGGAM